MTLWFAQTHMHLDHLIHVDGCGANWDPAGTSAVDKSGAGPLKPGGRPDFLGFGLGERHVFETKGRTRRAYGSQMAQASMLATINGRPPDTRVAACFVFRADGVEGQVQDLPGRTRRARPDLRRSGRTKKDLRLLPASRLQENGGPRRPRLPEHGPRRRDPLRDRRGPVPETGRRSRRRGTGRGHRADPCDVGRPPRSTGSAARRIPRSATTGSSCAIRPARADVVSGPRNRQGPASRLGLNYVVQERQRLGACLRSSAGRPHLSRVTK